MAPRLIYCADGNPRFAKIAIDAGFEYGARLPGSISYPIMFADQDWKKPNREAYMAALAEHRPEMATILDWEREDQRTEILSWAEEVAQYVERVLFIPKILGIIETIPRRINGADVMLAYSVPTRYGGTYVPVWEFDGWAVHLLGGSPQRQMEMRYYLDVVSVDGNMMCKLAIRHCQFWVNGTAAYAQNRYWPTLREANGGTNWPGEDAPYEAFRRSCENIVETWRLL